MAIKTYSKSKDGKKKLSDHFVVSEFACSVSDTIKIDTDLIDILERLYTYLGCSKMVITSGYRTPAYDRQVGGNGRGYHTTGQAADVNCWYKENGKEYRYHGSEICCALQELGWTHGIGWIAGCAVHVDTRATQYWFDEQNKCRSIGKDWYTYMQKKGYPVDKFGDVNSDGKVDSVDARIVLQAAEGKIKLTSAQKKAADVNNDGKVNATDAQAILKKAVKK